jgi:hypothetical protein
VAGSTGPTPVPITCEPSAGCYRWLTGSHCSLVVGFSQVVGRAVRQFLQGGEVAHEHAGGGAVPVLLIERAGHGVTGAFGSAQDDQQVGALDLLHDLIATRRTVPAFDAEIITWLDDHARLVLH